MIINLNSDIDEVLDCILKYPTKKILDITGILQNKKITQKVVFGRELDKDHSIEKIAIERYVQTIGLLSSEYRDISTNGISLWWLTGLAEKHDSFHWGQNIFFLLELFKEKKELFKGDLHIILPKKNIGLPQFIEDNITCDHPFKVTFSKNTEKDLGVYYLLKSMFKASLKYSLFKFKTFAIPTFNIDEKCNYFFITPSINLANSNDSKFNIGWLKHLINETHPAINIPYVQFHLLDQLDLNKNHINNYISSAPNLKIVFFTFVKVFLLFINLNKKTFAHEANSILFNKNLINSAFKDVLRDLNCFLNHEWLKKHTRTHHNTYYLYDDEMYKFGRLLSASLKNDKNKSIGIQHGLISNNHTVYRIINEETLGENSIPLPSKIILWNKSFGKVITKSCDELNKRILYSNDYHYLDLINKKNQVQKKTTNQKEINVLWATTLWSHFLNEYEIIKPIFFLKNINLTIRLHPANHINKNQLNKKLADKNYQISTSSYVEDLVNSDIIITNTFSTVFYDASKIKIPVFRIEHFGSFNDMENNHNGVFNVKSSEGFLLQFNKLIEEKKDATKIHYEAEISNIKQYLSL